MYTDEIRSYYGQFERSVSSERWSPLPAWNADVLVHAGDLAVGWVDQRRWRVTPLDAIEGKRPKVYITVNHEYRSATAAWV